jgi:hypothetical protein
VDDILGVVKVLPVLILVPPVAAAYQLIVPVLAVAAKLSVPVSHLVAGVVLVNVGRVPTLKAIFTELEQPTFEVIV